MTPMEELWEKIASPGPSGEKFIHYKSEYNLVYLYANGFVDFRKYSLKGWIDAFGESRQKDGSFRISRDQWIAKGRYRYDGPIGPLFDPNKLKERDYTEAEFAILLKRSICPATTIPEKNIPAILDHYRKGKKLVDGKIRMDRSLKREIAATLQKIPSPLRQLQLTVALFRKKGPAAPTAPTAPAKSGYATGKEAGHLAAERLVRLASGAKPAPATKPAAGGIPLKDLRKRRTPGRV